MEKAGTDARTLDQRTGAFETLAWRTFGKITDLRDELGDLAETALALEAEAGTTAGNREACDRLSAQHAHIALAHEALWLAWNIFDEVGV